MSAEKLVDEAETKLGIKFPLGYRQVFAQQSFLTVKGQEEIFLPNRVYPISEESWSHLDLSQERGFVIGNDVGGNAFVLRFQKGSNDKLDEIVWLMDHETGEFSKLASSLHAYLNVGTIEDELEQQANAFLSDLGEND